jgi:SPP1 gp7 family putative phage head morphogenesis protein
MKKKSYWQIRKKQVVEDKKAVKSMLKSEETAEEYIAEIVRMKNRISKDLNNSIMKMKKSYMKRQEVEEETMQEYLDEVANQEEIAEYKKLLEKQIENTFILSEKEALIAKYNAISLAYRIERTEILNAHIQSTIAELANNEYKITSEYIKKVIKDTSAKLGFERRDEILIENMMTTRFKGANFSERIWKNTDKLAKELNTTLKDGLIIGKSPQEIARDIAKKLDVETFYASRIVRTEGSFFHNLVSLERIKKGDHEKVKIIATLDKRTSEICRHKDQQIVEVAKAEVGVTIPPFHPFCRSTIVPYIEDIENLSNTRLAKDQVTDKYYYTEAKDYTEYFKEQKERHSEEKLNHNKVDNTKETKQAISDNAINETNKYYLDIKEEWKKETINTEKATRIAESVEIGDTVYYTNDINKIKFRNMEKENGEWLVNKLGGVLEYNPDIFEKDGIKCADYKYKKNDDSEWMFIDNKEIKGNGKNVFYHAVEDQERQAKVFLLDCTNSNLSYSGMINRLEVVFRSKKTQYVKTVIIKKGDELIGVFEKQ